MCQRTIIIKYSPYKILIHLVLHFYVNEYPQSFTTFEYHLNQLVGTSVFYPYDSSGESLFNAVSKNR